MLEIYRRAVSYFGATKQKLKAIEEIGKNRFGQECRYMRYRLLKDGSSGTPTPTKRNVAGSVII